MINLRTRADKLRFAQQSHRIMDLLERSMRKALIAEFERTARDAGKSYPNMDGVYKRHEDAVARLLTQQYSRITGTFAKRARDIVAAATNKVEKKAKTESDLEDELGKWARKRALSKVGPDISKTTKRKMKNIIAEGLKKADNPRKIASALREEMESLSLWRAQTIARTETHVAAMTAEFETVKGEDVLETKEWVATNDDRTRDAHAEVSGTVIGIKEEFSVDNEKMDHPGDPSASAANVINCRCVLVYGIK